MGHEWSVKLRNRSLIETIPLIQRCLLDEGIEDIFTNPCRGVIVPPSQDGSSYWGLSLTIEDNYLYFLCYDLQEGEKIVERLRQTLEENGFDVIVEEL